MADLFEFCGDDGMFSESISKDLVGAFCLELGRAPSCLQLGDGVTGNRVK